MKMMLVHRKVPYGGSVEIRLNPISVSGVIEYEGATRILETGLDESFWEVSESPSEVAAQWAECLGVR